MDVNIGKILVVDDEENVRTLLKRTLGDLKHDVDTAANGDEALYKLSRDDFDVVLLDMKMPGMMGTEVLQEIMLNWPDTIVIVVTAVDDADVAVEAINLGAYDYITKPFDRANLINRIQNAVEKRDLRRYNKRYLDTLEQRVNTQAKKLQEYFSELVESLMREHNNLFGSWNSKSKEFKKNISKLPPELQKPMSSLEEYKSALLKLLKRTG